MGVAYEARFGGGRLDGDLVDGSSLSEGSLSMSVETSRTASCFLGVTCARQARAERSASSKPPVGSIRRGLMVCNASGHHLTCSGLARVNDAFPVIAHTARAHSRE